MSKIIFGSLASFLLLVVGYLILMYFFFKPAKPIMEYEFPNMTYKQLEEKISNQHPKRLRDVIQLSEEELQDSTAFATRFVILGKDSLRFSFITYTDEAYKFKTKNSHTKKDFPWLEFIAVTTSKSQLYPLYYKNRDEHPELIKLFEDEFIKKINNGKVNVIERGFWDWF